MSRVKPKKKENIVTVRGKEVVAVESVKIQAWTTTPVMTNFTPEDFKPILNNTNHTDIGFKPIQDKSNCQTKTAHVDCYAVSMFYQRLRPMFRALLFSGLFFKRSETPDGKIVTGKWMPFCALICLILIGNSIRSFLVFNSDDSFNDVLFIKISFGLWSLETCAKGLALFSASYRTDKLPLFFKLWREVCDDREPDKFLKLVMTKSLFMGWQFTVVNTAGIGVTIFLVPDLSDLFLKAGFPGAADAEFQLPYQIAMITLIYCISSVSMNSVALLVVLSTAVSREFFKVNKEFSAHISCDGNFKSDLEVYRLRHQGLCRLVDVLDDIFTVIIAAVLMSNIPMCCVILYNLIYASEIFSILLLNIFWVLFLFFHMTVVATVCAYINTGAHAPLSAIYNIRAEYLKDHSMELTLFLNRLTGYDIGLSALKMFVINRPAILTIFGMLITYFVLLVQFKSPVASTCQCTLNSTGTTWNGTLIT